MGPWTVAQLQSFLAVARLGSFSAAARELGVTKSAVSHAVKQLEGLLGVPLLVRTTRSVALTKAGRRLVEGAAPGIGQVLAALGEVATRPGDPTGRLRLSVPNVALAHVLAPVLPAFRKEHPRIELDIVAEDRFVDIVAEGYDAGVRLTEAIERDMIQVRLTSEFRFIVVGSPGYLARHGTPERPEDLLRHECFTFRGAATNTLYAWELERGKRSWRVPVRGGIVTNSTPLRIKLVEAGCGLTYVFEPMVEAAIRAGRLVRVLEAYAATVPGFYLYYPSRAQRSSALRAFVDFARSKLTRERARSR